jgi:LysR family glycine cleavage system transcriptional activator
MNDSLVTARPRHDTYRIDGQLLSDLWVFRAAARLGSITAAAEHLNVTQGAVSQRVLRLESRLDVQLFWRRKGKIELSATGAAVLEAMNTVANGLSETLGRIERVRRRALVVSCPPSLASEWLMPSLAQFQAACPDVELHVRAEMAKPSPRWMEAQQIDVLIDYLHGDAPGMHQLAQVQERILPVCSPRYREQLRNALPGDGKAVLLHDTAPWQEGELADAEWDEWMRSPGSALPFPVDGERHFNLAYLAYQAAMYGQGIAMGRLISVGRLLDSGHLVSASNGPPVPSATYRVLALVPAACGSPAARFAQWIETRMRQTQHCLLANLTHSHATVPGPRGACRRTGGHARNEHMPTGALPRSLSDFPAYALRRNVWTMR